MPRLGDDDAGGGATSSGVFERNADGERVESRGWRARDRS